jgi:hypothetical protein
MQPRLGPGKCLITTAAPGAYNKTATQTYLFRRQSRKTLYLDEGRLLVTPTDWRILCTHYPFNFCSVAPVDCKVSKFFRSADAWD